MGMKADIESLSVWERVGLSLDLMLQWIPGMFKAQHLPLWLIPAEYWFSLKASVTEAKGPALRS